MDWPGKRAFRRSGVCLLALFLFAHGFVALSVRADLSSKLTDYHAPDDGRAIEHVADQSGHDRRYAIEPARLKAELGWRPAILFARGLRDTIAWYLARPAWLA